MKILLISLFFLNIALARGPAEFSNKKRKSLKLKKLFPMSTCIKQAENFGKKSKISEECFDQLLLNSNYSNRVSTPDDLLLVVGYKNILFIKSKLTKELLIGTKSSKKNKAKLNTQMYILAGNQSKLNDILSITINSDLKTIAVLNRNKNAQLEILIFPTYRSGNFSPMKIISLKNIADDAVDILFHASNDEIFILNSLSKEIVLVSSLSDIRHHDKSHHPMILRKMILKENLFISPISVSLKDNSLMIGDKSSNMIYFIDADCDGTCEVLGEITDDILQSCDLADAKYLTLTKEVQLFNECDEEALFQLK
jgi:hypothetical protein